MDDDRRERLRLSYAAMIAEFRRARIFDSSLLRTLMDSWYAYERGGAFIKSTGNPRTFDKPSGRPEFEAMRQMPCISKAAWEVLSNRSNERLIKDHSIPVAVLRDVILHELSDDPSLEEVERWMRASYHVAALTHAEHEAIEHRATVPDYAAPRDPLARFEAIPIHDRSKFRADEK